MTKPPLLPNSPLRLTLAEFRECLKAQGVSHSNHYAFKCVVCGTVQSMASLVKAGAEPDRAESTIGFACEGRITDAGAWPAAKDRTLRAEARRRVRGCDWTLGGLFTIHELVVVTEDGEEHPRFVLASPDEARALEAVITKGN